MLISLLPEQVSFYWDVIRYAIMHSLPPLAKAEVDMNKVLECALLGQLQVWTAMNSNDKVVAVLTTMIVEDGCSGTKNLLIYSLFGLGIIGPQLWREDLETLKGYARSKGCSMIIAYTDAEVGHKLAKLIGGNDYFTLVRLEV